jgi:hypothetical protein
VLTITSELRADASMRVDIEASPETGLRVASQVMVDWPQTIRLTEMGPAGWTWKPCEPLREQLAIVLGIGGTGKPRRLA